MARAKCFRCQNGYDSNNPDDLAGDGRCSPCKELAKRIAFEIDIKMSEHRRKNPILISPYKKLIDQLPPDVSGRIIVKASDLGVNFQP